MIPPCESGEALPDGHDVCHVMRTGEALDDFCQGVGYNLEYRFVRREHVYIPPGTVIRADCVLSSCPALDCPGLEPRARWPAAATVANLVDMAPGGLPIALAGGG